MFYISDFYGFEENIKKIEQKKFEFSVGPKKTYYVIKLLCSVISTQSYTTYKIFSVILQCQASALITHVSIFPIRKKEAYF